MATLKKDIIKMFSLATTVEPFEKNSVILLTALGTIVGDLAPEDGAGSPGSAIISTLLDKANELHPTDELNDNDGYVHLSNARILHAGGQSNLGDIVVFMDQIIGITLGNLN